MLQIESHGPLTTLSDGRILTVLIAADAHEVATDDWTQATHCIARPPDYWHFEPSGGVAVWLMDSEPQRSASGQSHRIRRWPLSAHR